MAEEIMPTDSTMTIKPDMDQFVKSLAFEVEAIPRENTKLAANASNSTPLSLKVKVRKRNESNMKDGVLSIPRPENPGSAPQRIRLISSDQTIASFDVLMEADFPEKPKKKPRRNFFGGCLGTQYDDDDVPYTPSTTQNEKAPEKSTDISKSDAVLKHPLTKMKYENPEFQTYQKRQGILGKCKPGGCLDPPFGEDKYAYKPAKEKSTKPTIQKESILDSGSKECLKNQVKEKPLDDAVISLYEADNLKSNVDNKYSDSIITYPPEATSSTNFVPKVLRSRLSNEEKQRRSRNESSDSFFCPSITSKHKGKRSISLTAKEIDNNIERKSINDKIEFIPILLQPVSISRKELETTTSVKKEFSNKINTYDLPKNESGNKPYSKKELLSVEMVNDLEDIKDVDLAEQKEVDNHKLIKENHNEKGVVFSASKTTFLSPEHNTTDLKEVSDISISPLKSEHMPTAIKVYESTITPSKSELSTMSNVKLSSSKLYIKENISSSGAIISSLKSYDTKTGEAFDSAGMALAKNANIESSTNLSTEFFLENIEEFNKNALSDNEKRSLLINTSKKTKSYLAFADEKIEKNYHTDILTDKHSISTLSQAPSGNIIDTEKKQTSNMYLTTGALSLAAASLAVPLVSLENKKNSVSAKNEKDALKEITSAAASSGEKCITYEQNSHNNLNNLKKSSIKNDQTDEISKNLRNEDDFFVKPKDNKKTEKEALKEVTSTAASSGEKSSTYQEYSHHYLNNLEKSSIKNDQTDEISKNLTNEDDFFANPRNNNNLGFENYKKEKRDVNETSQIATINSWMDPTSLKSKQLSEESLSYVPKITAADAFFATPVKETPNQYIIDKKNNQNLIKDHMNQSNLSMEKPDYASSENSAIASTERIATKKGTSSTDPNDSLFRQKPTDFLKENTKIVKLFSESSLTHMKINDSPQQIYKSLKTSRNSLSEYSENNSQKILEKYRVPRISSESLEKIGSSKVNSPTNQPISQLSNVSLQKYVQLDTLKEAIPESTLKTVPPITSSRSLYTHDTDVQNKVNKSENIINDFEQIVMSPTKYSSMDNHQDSALSLQYTLNNEKHTPTDIKVIPNINENLVSNRTTYISTDQPIEMNLAVVPRIDDAISSYKEEDSKKLQNLHKSSEDMNKIQKSLTRENKLYSEISRSEIFNTTGAKNIEIFNNIPLEENRSTDISSNLMSYSYDDFVHNDEAGIADGNIIRYSYELRKGTSPSNSISKSHRTELSGNNLPVSTDQFLPVSKTTKEAGNSIGSKIEPIKDTDFINQKFTFQGKGTKSNEHVPYRDMISSPANELKKDSNVSSLKRDIISLDIGFHSYTTDRNDRILKTIDTTSQPSRYPDDTITLIRSRIRPQVNDIKIPIDSDYEMTLQLRRNKSPLRVQIHENFQSSNVTPLAKSQDSKGAAKMQGSSFHDEFRNSGNNNLFNNVETQNLLNSIYEKNLIPLQKAIRYLTQDITFLSKQQKVLLERKTMINKNKQVVRGSARCGCQKTRSKYVIKK